MLNVPHGCPLDDVARKQGPEHEEAWACLHFIVDQQAGRGSIRPRYSPVDQTVEEVIGGQFGDFGKTGAIDHNSPISTLHIVRNFRQLIWFRSSLAGGAGKSQEYPV